MKESILGRWVYLKHTEDQLKKERKEIEQKLIEKYYVHGGGKTQRIEDRGFMVEMKESETLKVDQIGVEELFNRYDKKLLPFRQKFEVDATKYKNLKDFNEDFYEMCSQFVTIAPGSTSVSVKEKE